MGSEFTDSEKMFVAHISDKEHVQNIQRTTIKNIKIKKIKRQSNLQMNGRLG